jgi:hypothetical protein
VTALACADRDDVVVEHSFDVSGAFDIPIEPLFTATDGLMPVLPSALVLCTQ